MLFTGNETREEIIALISEDAVAFDNVIAMANVGAAFSAIWVLESLVAGLVLISAINLQKKLSSVALDASDLLSARHSSISGATLGRLVDAIEKSGIEGRDIRYLRAIVSLRNDFVHRLGDQVPLPGDWERYGYNLEAFSSYTRYVLRHVHMATRFFSQIMVRHGLLSGKFGDFGAVLWNPNDPFFQADDGED